jgi:anti-sigma factor RsiW
VDAYVDGEVDPTAQIDFEQHLGRCAECQERVVFARAFKAQVREHLGGTRAPDGLRQRISTALDAVPIEVRASSSAPIVLMPMKTRYAVPVAVAATAVLALSYAVGSAPRGGDGGAPAEPSTIAASAAAPIFEDVVHVHSSGLPADVSANQPQEVVSFFRNRVAFPVRPAQFERRDARLVGARLSNVRDRRAAALYYNVGGQRLTVVLFDGSAPVDTGAQRARMLGQDLVYRQVHGYTVPVRNQDGINYAFTGDMDRQSLLHLAATARVTY